MQNYNPCMGCQWYNKPYWSVVNPCHNCHKFYNTVTYTTTTTLPTAKEYKEASDKMRYGSADEWSEPKYQCPECGGGMCKNLRMVLSSYPVKYKYQCDKCGHVEYQYI